MSVSSSETLWLGVGVKESPGFSISISCFVKNKWDKFIKIPSMVPLHVDW